MELTELLRLLLQRFDEWALPLYIAQGDVNKAVDNMRHGIMAEDFGRCQYPCTNPSQGRWGTLRAFGGFAGGRNCWATFWT